MESLHITLQESLAVLDSRDLAYDLCILSRLNYVRNNQQRFFKFFQAMKKVQRYMRKFSDLDLHKFITMEMSAPIKLRYTEESVTSLSTLLIKGYLYLKEASNGCIECTIYSLKTLNLHHFVALHTTVIALVSGIRSKSEQLQTKISQWYKSLSRYARVKKIKISAFPTKYSLSSSGDSKIDLKKPAKPFITVAMSVLQKKFVNDKNSDSKPSELNTLVKDVAAKNSKKTGNKLSQPDEVAVSADVTASSQGNATPTNTQKEGNPVIGQKFHSNELDLGVAIVRQEKLPKEKRPVKTTKKKKKKRKLSLEAKDDSSFNLVSNVSIENENSDPNVVSKKRKRKKTDEEKKSFKKSLKKSAKKAKKCVEVENVNVN